jgi:uncharacterized protein
VGSAVVHFEVVAAADGPLAEFYGQLFGWGLHRFPGGRYTMIDTQGGGGINGGIGTSQHGEAWSTFYVETGDLQATLDKAHSLGGTTVMPPADIGRGLAVAVLGDPDGLPVGLIRAAGEPAQGSGPAPSAGSGAPVDWFEILGSDAARTQRFYADLFGWTIDDSGIREYALVDTGTGRGIKGGIGGGQDQRWATVYARVADVDEVLGQAEKLGGARISDTGVAALKNAARIALYGSAGDITTDTFRDPAGNVFGIYGRLA